ncbi:MAG: ornithine carbamoyltransferase [Candidatus Limnocylindria bacterium]
MTTPTLPASRAATRAAAALRPPPRHLLSAGDFAGLGIDGLLDRAQGLRRDRHRGRHAPLLAGRQVALLFDKPSLRTRVSFEVGIQQLGGNAIFLAPEEVQLGRREPAADVGRNLSRWVDAIVVRCSDPRTIRALAAAASVPVINALDDGEHPCQALADMLTLRQHLGDLSGHALAYVGDGNNVCHSLLLAAALAGMRVRVGTPDGHAPSPDIVAAARRLGAARGGSVQVGSDPAWAVEGADAVYTDVWTSMGFESQAEARRARFVPYQVNDALLARAPDALVMHCLPAHRGEEITASVLDGPRCVALDQAENRLYAQQALLVRLLTPR